MKRHTRRHQKKRRQRGGDRRLLYLALVAWVLAIANALGKDMEVTGRLVTSPKVYRNASDYYDTLKEKPGLLTSAVPSAAPTPSPVPIPKDRGLVEKAALGLAKLYTKTDALTMQGVEEIVKLSGVVVVNTAGLLDGAFGWLSNSAFALADRIEGKAPLLEDVPKVVELVKGAKYTIRGKLHSDLRQDDPVIFVDTFKDDGVDMYTIRRANNEEAGEYEVSAKDVTLTPVTGGRRRKSRKTLRRKK